MPQPTSAVEQNAAYFADNERYAQLLGTLDTYRLIADTITRELRGTRQLVDVGNGGAFDYDPSVVEQIVAVDLFPAGHAMPPNARFVQGSALDLPLEDQSADVVVMVMLLHHLVGETPRMLMHNVHLALREAHRVLRPGGRLVVVESCVPMWFARIEPWLYRPLAWFAARSGHPPVFQLPARAVRNLVYVTFGGGVRVERVPMGRWALQVGRKWPTALTPARTWLFEARRGS